MVAFLTPGTSRTAVWQKEVKKLAYEMYGNKCSVCGITEDLYLKFNKDENGKPYTLGYAKAMCFGKEYATLLCGTCRRTMWVTKKSVEELQEKLKDSDYLADHQRMQRVQKIVNYNIEEQRKKQKDFLRKLNPRGKMTPYAE